MNGLYTSRIIIQYYQFFMKTFHCLGKKCFCFVGICSASLLDGMERNYFTFHNFYSSPFCSFKV